MRANIVLTLTGKDRVGIVDELTQSLLNLGGNIETSRMARLGGEFAILMLVSLPTEQVGAVEPGLQNLVTQGYKITTNPTDSAPVQATWQAYRIEVLGADHEGIIHEITHLLSQHGINIESMETGTRPAPISGSPLFTMQALVAAPPESASTNWETQLEEMGDRLNVEIKVSAAES